MTRNNRTWAAMAVAFVVTGVLLVGCVQLVKLVTVALGNLSAVNGAAAAGKYVDLAAENRTYADNRDKFKNVDDVAVLGTFRNNAGAAVSADVWIVTNPSGTALLPNLAAVQTAGGVKLWSMSLAANETKNVTWNDSARLVTPVGRTALKDELAGDATFTLYVFGSTGTYNISVTNGQVVAMIVTDVGP